MNTPRHFKDILRISYGCMACDGDIDPDEVVCLRSIGVQMGIPVEEVDAGVRLVVSRMLCELAQAPVGRLHVVAGGWPTGYAEGVRHVVLHVAGVGRSRAKELGLCLGCICHDACGQALRLGCGDCSPDLALHLCGQ